MTNLGIAVTTFNRSRMVAEQVETLRRRTSCAFDLVVCDDGSTDDTVAALRGMSVTVIAGQNRGVAWNKNRGLFFLMHACGSDVIILLDDDVQPLVCGWEQEWIMAARNHGHVNHLQSAEMAIFGAGTADHPFVTPVIPGICLAMTRRAASLVGYMDPRFGQYGHEHTDFSIRFIRAGFGGFTTKTGGRRENLFYAVSGGLAIRRAESHCDEICAEHNRSLLQQSANEMLYRNPWNTESEFINFRKEMDAAAAGFQRPDSLAGLDEFDEAAYLLANPDVAATGRRAFEHYLTSGRREGRLLRPVGAAS